MKIGIDSYCFHRFFGEVYPGQKTPDKLLTTKEFLQKSYDLGLNGVSLESCFLPSLEEDYLKELKSQIEEFSLEVIYAWGHPFGLERGQSEAAFLDLCASIPRAKLIGADTMRVCGASSMYLADDRSPHVKALIHQFQEIMTIADSYQVKIAMENHHDFTADEMLQIIEGVGSPNFGVTFDSGNFLRLLDDPLSAIQKLAPYTFATHLKDVALNGQAKPNDWFFFSAVPLGQGLIDHKAIIQTLKEANFSGLLTLEIDYPHPDWANREEDMVEISVRNLRKMADEIYS